MSAFGFVAALAASFAVAASGAGQSGQSGEDGSTKVSEVVASAESERVLREVILGVCMKRVRGTAPVTSTLDPDDETAWSMIRPVETTGGLTLFAPRAHKATQVLLDFAPEDVSCWVQGATRKGGGFAERLRYEIQAAGGLVVSDSRQATRSTLFMINGGPPHGSTLIMLHEYGGADEGLITAVVKRASAEAGATTT